MTRIVNGIYVCQASTCRSRGSDATLVEIEELAKLVECDVHVDASGCLGYCSQGPAVEVERRSKFGRKRKYHVKVKTFQKSAAVVRSATGEDPPGEDDLPPETSGRLREIRMTKQREYFASTYQWNRALSGASDMAPGQARKARPQLEAILRWAGYPNVAVRDLQHRTDGDGAPPLRVPTLPMPASIEGYVPWTLRSVDVVSAHSAVFKFATSNLKRGTPHPRGRARMAEPVTWHVTMLGEVGRNDEGPLPWVERDYTPISSALEWERGSCEILIKVYQDGLLTSWLQRRIANISNGRNDEEDVRIWLSKPIKTLSVPSLTPDGDDEDSFRPKSVLLLLAGTGIVALSILAHREPHRMLGIATPRYKQLLCPIDLVHSCREDDVLLLPQIRQYCLEGHRPHPRHRGLRNYTLLLSEKKGPGPGDEDRRPPFQEHFGDEDDAADHVGLLKDVLNARTMRTRLDGRIVADAVGKMTQPFRVVVSGPNEFNKAARGFLVECGVASGQVTLLSA